MTASRAIQPTPGDQVTFQSSPPKIIKPNVSIKDVQVYIVNEQIIYNNLYINRKSQSQSLKVQLVKPFLVILIAQAHLYQH